MSISSDGNTRRREANKKKIINNLNYYNFINVVKLLWKIICRNIHLYFKVLSHKEKTILQMLNYIESVRLYGSMKFYTYKKHDSK